MNTSLLIPLLLKIECRHLQIHQEHNVTSFEELMPPQHAKEVNFKTKLTGNKSHLGIVRNRLRLSKTPAKFTIETDQTNTTFKYIKSEAGKFLNNSGSDIKFMNRKTPVKFILRDEFTPTYLIYTREGCLGHSRNKLKLLPCHSKKVLELEIVNLNALNYNISRDYSEECSSGSSDEEEKPGKDRNDRSEESSTDSTPQNTQWNEPKQGGGWVHANHNTPTKHGDNKKEDEEEDEEPPKRHPKEQWPEDERPEPKPRHNRAIESDF